MEAHSEKKTEFNVGGHGWGGQAADERSVSSQGVGLEWLTGWLVVRPDQRMTEISTVVIGCQKNSKKHN